MQAMRYIGRTFVVPVAGFALLVGCGAVPTTPAQDRSALPSPHVPSSKIVSFDGVQLRVPSSWPVIDGAHARYECRSAFEGQTDRVFVGSSDFPVHGCPFEGGKPPPADGVWFRKLDRMEPIPGKRTRLPSGVLAQIQVSLGYAEVTVRLRNVSIDIGIGPRPALETEILDSITYQAGSPDSPTLGRCPTPPASAPTMPNASRLTTSEPRLDGLGLLTPAGPTAQPIVTARTAWRTMISQLEATTFGKALHWKIQFALGDANTVWVIDGQPPTTAWGPCGVTIQAIYDASTGAINGITGEG